MQDTVSTVSDHVANASHTMVSVKMELLLHRHYELLMVNVNYAITVITWSIKNVNQMSALAATVHKQKQVDKLMERGVKRMVAMIVRRVIQDLHSLLPRVLDVKHVLRLHVHVQMELLLYQM